MKSGFYQFVMRVRREARRKPQSVVLKSMGRTRMFSGYDWGSDTFIFEKDAWSETEEHQPILLIRKSDLIRGGSGYVMTLTTGNHAVASIPLLSGQFWNLGRVAPSRRTRLLMNHVICANLVDGKIEISQRDVQTPWVVEADEWLQGLGFSLNEVVLLERNDLSLEYYRRQGQEWRVKPLAWARKEMEFALRTSRKRINTSLRYYHSVKGVHFLSYADFHALLDLVETDYDRLILCLRELVSIFEGDTQAYVRTPKFHGHHEIEFFGLNRGESFARLIPELEKLMEGVALMRVSRQDVADQLQKIDTLFKLLLERPELADDQSDDFIETMYLHLTGAIYVGHSDSVVPAFDDRRTALPGATYRGGRPEFHTGADDRTRVLLANIEKMMSEDELIEYANVYEVRAHEEVPLGSGVTREIVFKTNRRPLCTSLIEKRLKITTPGYGSYMLARVQAFKALGVNFGDYRLLMRLDKKTGREVTHFIRNRCPGESLNDIPARIFHKAGEFGGHDSGKDPEVILGLGALLGNAAAQNLVLKKFLPETRSCRYGVGKEIFEFAYDIVAKREMPVQVMLCSIRGSFGWPDLSYTEENLNHLFDFYFNWYATALMSFWKKHQDAVEPEVLANRFFDGFEQKTREMQWNYSVRREQFDAFDPKVRHEFAFVQKWRFALWALDRQTRRLESLRTMFIAKVLEKRTP